jgi:endogenous inhibitor of DNA gyrase (YacG/DUF329 family)
MGPCDNCNQLATTTLYTRVGTFYFCSEKCTNIVVDIEGLTRSDIYVTITTVTSESEAS